MSITTSLTVGSIFVAVMILSASAAEVSVAPSDLPRVPATPAEMVQTTFQVKHGFRMDLVAAEPLVASPVAMAFDENGRLFVVEMIDYSERRDERLGRVRMLEDTDGDGHFDKSTTYADGLPWPTAVFCWDGGIFVGATPDILYLKDIDGDGKADIRRVVFTGFGNQAQRLNVQQLLNSFNWGLDNRIHGAPGGNASIVTSPAHPEFKPLDLRGRDFSFDPRTLDIRAETGGAQHGMSFDDVGRKFVCSNSAHIQMLMYDESEASQSPFYTMPRPLVDIAEDGPAAPVFRTSPDEPWRVIRTKWRVSGQVPGLIEGGGRPSGYFTGATGVTIYRGDAYPEEYRGDAFIADCGSNLIHRKKLFPDDVGLIARRPADEKKIEFVTSTDNWFRPVQFANAPDGALYVIDMYRETIEHPWSLPEPLKSHLDLNSGNDRGRIYRIVPDGFKQPKLPKLGSAATKELVHTLNHSNGWHRDTAARLLYSRNDPAAVPLLESSLTTNTTLLGRIHALHALAGAGALQKSHLRQALADPDEWVRVHGIKLAASLGKTGLQDSTPDLFTKSPAYDASLNVRHQFALSLPALSRGDASLDLHNLVYSDVSNARMRAAILNASVEFPGRLFQAMTTHSRGSTPSENDMRLFLRDLVGVIGRKSVESDIQAVLTTGLGRMDKDSFALIHAMLQAIPRAPGGEPAIPKSTQMTVASVYEAAKKTAANSGSREADRVAAIPLIGLTPWNEAAPILRPLLEDKSPAVRLASISALARYSEREANQEISKRWSILSPRSRSEFLTLALSRTDRIALLLDTIEANQISRADLSSTQIEQLRNHRESSIQTRASALLPKPAASRADVLAGLQSSLLLDGDVLHGKKLFSERCATCHKLGNEGHAVAPDLASVRSNGKPKLLASIVDPNLEVAPSFFNYAVELKNGESLGGIIVNEAPATLTLRRAFAEESIVQRSDIQRLQSSGLSLMPEGLEAGLNPQDMADLMEYVMIGE